MMLLQEYSLYLLAMAALAAGSAFFSASEAALFSLQMDDRRVMKAGNAGQRIAIDLLNRPDRVLSAILFWNLLFNVTFFTLASIVGIQLQHAGRATEAGGLAVTALVALILGGEILPKTIGVQFPRQLAGLLSFPLAGAVRALDPVMPAFSALNNFLRRLIAPNFTREPYLEINDLERAITMSKADAQLVAAEQSALQNIVLLSELDAEELMRPRNRFHAFQPPVSLQDLEPEALEAGDILITEPDSDEIAAAINLKNLPMAPRQHLERFARPVAYVPWCATVAAVLDELVKQEREVAAVVNELGETIGVITMDDVLETIFEENSSRSARMLATAPIVPAGEGRWRVTGMTNLRRLERHFDVDLAPARSVTVRGLLQELLQRLPAAGDEVEWGGFRFHVIEAPDDGPLTVELQIGPGEGPLP